MKINNLFSLNNLNNCWYSEKRYHTKTKDDQVMRGFHWLNGKSRDFDHSDKFYNIEFLHQFVHSSGSQS